MYKKMYAYVLGQVIVDIPTLYSVISYYEIKYALHIKKICIKCTYFPRFS